MHYVVSGVCSLLAAHCSGAEAGYSAQGVVAEAWDTQTTVMSVCMCWRSKLAQRQWNHC